MNVLELEQELNKERGKTQEAATKLLAILENDTSLLAYFRQQSQVAPPATPVATLPATPTATPAATPSAAKPGVLQNVGDFFRDTFGTTSAAANTPEKKALEVKVRIIKRIEALNVAGGPLRLGEALVKQTRERIESRYAELAQSAAPHWTEGNTVVVTAAIALLAFNWIRKGSFWGGVESTAKAGLWFGGAGLAAYAAKELGVGTKIGEMGEFVWNKVFVHVPGVTQDQQKEIAERTRPVENPEAVEQKQVGGLQDVLREYRQQLLTVSTSGRLRGTSDIAQDIRVRIEQLKQVSQNPRLKTLLQKMTISNPPTIAEVNALLKAMQKSEIEAFYKDAVPGEVSDILSEQNTILDQITDEDDVPPGAREKDSSFRKALETRANESTKKIREAKDRQSSYMAGMKRAVVYLHTEKAQAADRVDKLSAIIKAQKKQGQTDTKALEQQLSGLKGILNDSAQFEQSYREALAKPTTDVYDQLQANINGTRDLILADRPTGSLPPYGKRAQVEAFYDQILGFEMISNASVDLPNDITTPTTADYLLTGAAATGIMGLAYRYIGLSGLVNAIPTAADYAGRAFVGTLRGAGAGFTVAKNTVNAIKSVTSNPFEAGKNFRTFLSSMKVNVSSPVVLGVTTFLAARSFWIAYENFNMSFRGIEGISETLRFAQGAVNTGAGIQQTRLAVKAIRDLSAFNAATKARTAVKGALFWENAKTVGASLFTEAVRTLASGAIDNIATSREIDRIPFDSIPMEQLVMNLQTYSDNIDSQIWQAAKNRFSDWAGMGPSLVPIRRQMREKTMRAIATRSGLSPEGANMMIEYYGFASKDLEYSGSGQHAEILTYSILYAKMRMAGVWPFENANISNSSHGALKPSIDAYLQGIENQEISARLSEKTGRQITEDPEVRYLMESFGGDYVQTVSFWRMCVKAKDNPALTAEQKAKVGLYANYAAVYIQENGGFRGADPAPATVTFDEITALIERQKNLDVPAADNRLLNYYSEAYTLGLFSVTTTEITSQASQQNTLKQFLQTKGVTEQNAQKFANEFFKVGTIYRKGSTDGLLHVEISGKKAVFIGGKWREVYDVKNSGWTKTDRDYDCYQRTVDGVTYYYLPEYRCFLTGDMNPPANKIDFAGSYNNGTYIPPKYPITKMATLTSVDIPVAVSDGLIQFFESQPRFSS